MEDLFPETWRPESLGADAIPCIHATFFAIYPEARDLPRVVEWQRNICRQEGAVIRPPEILHVSVAECGKSKRRLRPLPKALSEAAHHFSFPAFDLVFDSIARFGQDGRACVAVADAASQEVRRPAHCDRGHTASRRDVRLPRQMRSASHPRLRGRIARGAPEHRAFRISCCRCRIRGVRMGQVAP